MMSVEQEVSKIGDPSVNVVMLVGNAVSYIEKIIALNQKLADDKLKLCIESIQREQLAEAKRINDRLSSDKEAMDITRESTEALRKSVEGTIGALADQVKSIATQHNERITALEKANNENRGSGMGMRELWGWVVGGVMLAITVVRFLTEV